MCLSGGHGSTPNAPGQRYKLPHLVVVANNPFVEPHTGYWHYRASPSCLLCPALIVEASNDDARLTSVCLSRTSGLSR